MHVIQCKQEFSHDKMKNKKKYFLGFLVVYLNLNENHLGRWRNKIIVYFLFKFGRAFCTFIPPCGTDPMINKSN